MSLNSMSPTIANICRSCKNTLKHTFVDLGLTPISNAFIKPDDLRNGEKFYPLHAFVCHHCWLVQLDNATQANSHFHDDYIYFSSFSASWLDHARRYVGKMIERFGLNQDSSVIEIASNDGYLLQYFVQEGISCLGVEPSANTAAAARQKGVESREVFFGRSTAKELADQNWLVDLLLGNNVLAHVPDINDFVGGMPIVLKPDGVITLEFPHLLTLLDGNQFDTLYHEHYSYLSLTALVPIFKQAGLRFFDVEHIPTHGGSLRVYACHEDATHATSENVLDCLTTEESRGLKQLSTYMEFGEKVRETKRAILEFMVAAKREGKRIAAYGAAAKGNTLLNYCGVRTDFIDFVVDKNPTKQGRFLPGSRIPVCNPEAVFETQPDYLLILPWNIKEEVMEQMAEIRSWGGKFIVLIPTVEVIQ